jgi:glycosyltransferase involved in cell wall biosynthesis
MAGPATVLFLVPALVVGGAERQIAALARALDRSRFRPLVACQHALGPVAEEIEHAGIPVRLLSGRGRADPAFFARLASLLRRERVRIIVSHGFSTGVAARLVGPIAGTPVRILAEHSTGERDMSPARHRINRLLAPLGTAWVAVAHGQRDYLLRVKGIPEARLRVIPNGIDPAPFRNVRGREAVRAEWGFPPEARVAGILAALRPEKDHKTFLLAARFVADELPEARFVLVGDGPRREDLSREAAVLDLTDRVVLAGARRDVAAVLSAFDVSVLCSTDVETFPLAFLESMASGLPLVGTKVGGLPEMIAEGRNGLLVRPRDPRGLADAMLALLRDPPLARRYGEESRRRVESEFSLERMVRAWEELFIELLPSAEPARPPGAGAS